MRRRLLAALLLTVLAACPALAQSRTYVIRNGAPSPGTTTFTPANQPSAPPSNASWPSNAPSTQQGSYATAAPGQRYDQVYYGDEAYMNSYRRVVRMYNPGISAYDLDTVVRSVLYYSYLFKVDPRFVVAVVAHESRFQTHAVSPAGAQGLGQLMPGTAASLGVDPHVPYQNIQGTVRYLKLMLDRFAHLDRHNQKRLALASYNAGYGAVTQYGGIPPYAETQRYVEVVMAEWRKLSGDK